MLGAGKAAVSGIFSVFTVLVLTLYLTASLPAVKEVCYRAVPASRRDRVRFLSEEITRRVGGYLVGQVAIATTNAICTYILLRILGLPYPEALAVVVGILGLIPMIGATLGAIIVVLVALFSSVTTALIVAVYYVVYQQIENYVIAPRVMHRTIAVPGALTVIAALAGATLLGVLGALMAIPVAAGLMLIYQEVLVPRQNGQDQRRHGQYDVGGGRAGADLADDLVQHSSYRGFADPEVSCPRDADDARLRDAGETLPGLSRAQVVVELGHQDQHRLARRRPDVQVGGPRPTAEAG